MTEPAASEATERPDSSESPTPKPEASPERTASVGVRLALTLTALAILALTALSPHPYDFCSYYSAGLIAQEEDPEAAFDRDRLNNRHAQTHSHHQVGPFFYSPLLLGPAVFLSKLEFETAQLVNQAGILLALGVILWCVLEPRRPLWLAALLAGAFALCDPVRVQFIYQNWTAWLVLFAVLGLRQTRRGHHRSAAVFWALSFHVKLWVALFLVPLWILGYRRLVAATLAIALVLLILPLPWTGIEAPLAYARLLQAEAGAGTEVFFNLISVPSSLARLARHPTEWLSSPRPVEHPALTLLSLAALGGYLALLWRRRRDGVFCLAVTIPFLLLFGPKMWDHGELLFLGLFALAALPRRVEMLAAVYLAASVVYFPSVQRLMREVLVGETSPLEVHALLLFFPLLNLLAAAVLVRDAGVSAGAPAGAPDNAEAGSNRDSGNAATAGNS